MKKRRDVLIIFFITLVLSASVIAAPNKKPAKVTRKSTAPIAAPIVQASPLPVVAAPSPSPVVPAPFCPPVLQGEFHFKATEPRASAMYISAGVFPKDAPKPVAEQSFGSVELLPQAGELGGLQQENPDGTVSLKLGKEEMGMCPTCLPNSPLFQEKLSEKQKEASQNLTGSIQLSPTHLSRLRSQKPGLEARCVKGFSLHSIISPLGGALISTEIFLTLDDGSVLQVGI